ncbi:MAG TPA: GNAT family N-acetyltransferase [Candidatus Binatia bacterium]|nr:GNAT family N-acetyltransferase [Candidatus Binatia bacterium]
MRIPSTDVPQAGTASELPGPQTAAGPALRVLRHPEEIAALADAWDSLAVAQAGGPMQYAAWAQAYAAMRGVPGQTLHVVVMGAPQPTAIAPLVKRPGRLARLELLGVHELYEPLDFLYASPAALDALAEALVHLGVPLFLERLPAASPVTAALRRAYRGRGLVLCRPTPEWPGCPWIPLDASWQQPEHHLNPGRRSDLRRARRIAERLGPVRCEVLAPTPAQLPPLLEEAFRVEAAGWKGHKGSALLAHRERGAFYRRYAEAACRQGMLRLCFLRIGEQAAAMQLAAECGGGFWLLKMGYDERFARCSPGMLLLLETIGHAARQGLRAYEMLGTVEPWTQLWAPQVRACVALRAYPARAQGLARLAADLSKRAQYRLSRAVRLWL